MHPHLFCGYGGIDVGCVPCVVLGIVAWHNRGIYYCSYYSGILGQVREFPQDDQHMPVKSEFHLRHHPVSGYASPCLNCAAKYNLAFGGGHALALQL